MRITMLMAAAVLSAGSPMKEDTSQPPVDISESEDDEYISVGRLFRVVFFPGFEQIDDVCIDSHNQELFKAKLACLKQEMDSMSPGEKEKMASLPQKIWQQEALSRKYLHESRQSEGQAYQRHQELEIEINANKQELKDINDRYPQLAQITLEVLRIIDYGQRSHGISLDVNSVNDEIYRAFGIIADYPY